MKKWEYAQRMGLAEEAVEDWNSQDVNDLLESRQAFVGKAIMELETLRYLLIHSEEEETYGLIKDVNFLLSDLEDFLFTLVKYHEELAE